MTSTKFELRLQCDLQYFCVNALFRNCGCLWFCVPSFDLLVPWSLFSGRLSIYFISVLTWGDNIESQSIVVFVLCCFIWFGVAVLPGSLTFWGRPLCSTYFVQLLHCHQKRSTQALLIHVCRYIQIHHVIIQELSMYNHPKIINVQHQSLKNAYSWNDIHRTISNNQEHATCYTI